MWTSIPFLIAQVYFLDTYRSWGLFKKKTSVASWLVARAYSFQIASLVAVERPGRNISLMKFAGHANEVAITNLETARSTITSTMADFTRLTGRQPLSPLDFTINTVLQLNEVPNMSTLSRYDETPIDRLNVNRDAAYERIFYDALLGIAYAFQYPNLVNASMYLNKGEMLITSDDRTGLDADLARANAESETLRSVAFELNPRAGQYRHLDLWYDLNLSEFAIAPVKMAPRRIIHPYERR